MVDLNPSSHLEDGEQEIESPIDDAGWLEKARDAFKSSSSWLDGSMRQQWERSIKLFKNEHPSGSKYQSAAYRRRSHIFRPKTRATVRRGEAAVAASFFSTYDAVSIRPNDDRDPIEVARAKLWHATLNYRLNRTLPWFRLCLGAYQDASVVGFCCSKQYWRYEVDEAGNVLADEPVIELLPPENVRIDPGADWLDPIKSSPYVIGLFPLYVGDVRDKINRGEWLPVSDSALRNAQEDDYDSTRQTREGKREDKYDDDKALLDHETCWVHENIFREDGQDWQFWTAGTTALLSPPAPLRSVYVHGNRPYVMGHGVLESHRAYPASKVELTQDLQTEANDIANLRLDNVKLALMPLVLGRQGVGLDIAGLVNRVPGKVIMTANPESDVVHDRPPDVTGSAFAEQDRINVDFDELAGSFSTSSVATNRKLNETVGGMSMLSNAASAIMEYDIRVFAETWVEPVLRQVLALEQAYETDQVILALAAREAQIVGPMPPAVMDGDVHLAVNVGIGATNPMEQLQKFQVGVKLIGEIFGPTAAMRAKFDEVVTEVFGKLGYRDGMRFFNIPDDPAVTHLTATIEQMQKALEAKQPEIQGRQQVATIQSQTDIKVQEMENQVKLLIKQMDMQLEQMRQQTQVYQQDRQLSAQDTAQRREIMSDHVMEYERAALAPPPANSSNSSNSKGSATSGQNAELTQAIQAMTAAMQQIGEAASMMALAAHQMSLPKQVIRDAAGSPIGIQSMPLDGHMLPN